MHVALRWYGGVTSDMRPWKIGTVALLALTAALLPTIASGCGSSSSDTPSACASPDCGDASVLDAPAREEAAASNEPPGVQLVGRFDTRNAEGPICAWPGCQIIARFTGTRVSVRMNEIDEDWMADAAPSEWDVTIDGAPRPKLVMKPGSNVYELASDLAAGAEHVVELYKRSEAQAGTTQYLGYDFGPEGKLLAPPPRKTRRLEIIGDSALAGFGIEGVAVGPDCPGEDYAAKWENFHRSAGALLGAQLGAETHGIVYSGKGIAKNIWHPDKETMPMIYTRATPIDPASTWDFAKFIPDVVVIMMGGNDFAIGQPVDEGPATLDEFKAAYKAFVASLRQHYPSAHIFLVTSPSVSDAEPAGRSSRTNVLAGIDAVVSASSAAGDAKVHSFVPVVATPSELTACDGHGNPAFHQRLANELEAIIRAKTGWQ